MKTGFIPIKKKDFIARYLSNNPGESEVSINESLDNAIIAYQKGKKCHCGNPLWVIGSAISGFACFTCITGESNPDGDYEIEGVCTEQAH
jgi:hypothetical protein